MSSNKTVCCHFSDKKPTNFCSNGGKTEKIKAKIEQGNPNIKTDNSMLRAEFTYRRLGQQKKSTTARMVPHNIKVQNYNL